MAAPDGTLAAVFRIAAFGGLWVANVLARSRDGQEPFAFVWLVGDQQPFPREPYGQQVDDAVVVRACEAWPPTAIRTSRGPAVHRGQV